MSEKKVALVTGGSRGIGKACAIELAKAGCDVALIYAGNEEAAKQTTDELTKLNVKAKAYKVDVKNFKEAENAIEQIHKDFERIDILVNNAGITRDNLILRMSEEEWNAVIDTNLTGVFNITKPVVKIMMKQRIGSIINMSSVAGVYGNAGQANYSSAKAGLIGFTKSLAKELGSRNIRVNAVAPGFIKTDMTKNLDGEKIAEKVGTLILCGPTSKIIEDAVNRALKNRNTMSNDNYDLQNLDLSSNDNAETFDKSQFNSNLKRQINIIHVNNMQEAVLKAKENAKFGDIVLLSPASASFDLYKNFAERGKVFKDYVDKIKII